jgi:pyridoxal 5'-phosphate synthase pdxS subunit
MAATPIAPAAAARTSWLLIEINVVSFVVRDAHTAKRGRWLARPLNPVGARHYDGEAATSEQARLNVSLSTSDSASPAGKTPYGQTPPDDARNSSASLTAEAPFGAQTGTARVKRGMAEMLKGGVIMDVVTAEQAKIAEDAGAVAVMALERVPADIRVQGGVARMSDPDMIDQIIGAVSIPVMAKCRIGHFVEAQVLQAIGVDYIDESEVLTPADEAYHVDKWKFTVPFVCGATNLGEALRRIAEGAAMIRSKGEAGTGNVVEATTHMRQIRAEMRRLAVLSADELYTAAKELRAPYELVAEVASAGRLPVVLFTAGGIATPADAAMMMQLGAEGVFVGSGIFKSGDPASRAAAIVKATTFYQDPDVIAKVSRGLGEPMVGINIDTLPPEQHYASRGW